MNDYKIIIGGLGGGKSELVGELLKRQFINLSISFGELTEALNSVDVSLNNFYPLADPQTLKVPKWKTQQTFGHGGKGDRIRKRQQWRRK